VSSVECRVSRDTCRAFTLVEILVVVVLLSFIVLALMAVFSGTQAAFRSSVTQSDVLESGRSVMGLVKSDLEAIAPSFGATNGAVNFSVTNNFWQYQSNNDPLVQTLTGTVGPTSQRTNVLESFFILTRQNTTWTGVGYVVDTASTKYLNPLYRFSLSTNVMAVSPAELYARFATNAISPISPTNPLMSHLVDGVVHLTVRAFDINGRWVTNVINFYNPGQPNNTVVRNTWFSPPTLGEVGFYMFSNTLPASVEIELGVLEDRPLQRAESLPDGAPLWTRSNYLAQQVGKVHLFRQRVPIRNVDPSAYQ